MILKRSVIFVLIVISCCNLLAQKSNNTLWYNTPAKDWNEALPIGNGRLGAMVFGRPDIELIQLNEQTLWTGGPVNLNPNTEAHNYLQQVRSELFKDSINKAVKLLKKMQGPNTEMYQPLGDIIIKQKYNGEAINIYRDLDINNAIATTNFTANGIVFTKEIFASTPDQIIVIKLTSNKPKQLNLSIDVQHELFYNKLVENNNELVLNGKARITSDDRRNPKPLIYKDSMNCDGMRFQFRVKAINKDGKISNTDTSLNIADATEVILYVTAATSFNGYDKCPDKDGKDEVMLAKSYLKSIENKPFTFLRDRHIKSYNSIFKRLRLSLNNSVAPNLPINERLASYKKGGLDFALEELFFQYGRYLLISSSRPGGMPANLQGIWNNQIRPSWRSNYTTNINLQMNYWLALQTNLAEMNLNLIEYVKLLAKNGTATAKNYYNMQGWVVHHNADIWAQTNPVGEGSGDPKWANWSLGSPWLCQHLYEQFRFTNDKKYLEEIAYPLMKSAAQFCLDWLVEKDGKLITVPSTSPENVYLHPNGFKGTVTIASAMDMEIIWDLFTNVIEADSILQKDKNFVKILKQKRSMLYPLQIGKNGNLVEWYGDWKDEDSLHRHVSHAFALHPGRQISPLIDTLYSNAIKKTLLTRGDGGTGWSKAWKINFWARLFDGNHAYKMYSELLKTSTLNNLFDTHPPFQIDGNFGATAGISEMLVQSQLNDIYLLPALPSFWKNGNVKGLIARGNFEIDLFWNNNALNKAFIVSKAGAICKIRTTEKIKIKETTFQMKQETVGTKKYFVTTFNTLKGMKYTIELQ